MNLVYPTVSITDFLSLAEIEFLVNLIMTDSFMEGDLDDNGLYVSKRHYPTAQNHKIVTDYLIKKLETHNIFPVIDSLWILEAFVPFPFHNDVNYIIPELDQSRYYTMIMPIEQVKAKTIICKQTADLEFVEDYMQTNQPINESQQYSLDFWQQHLSHCPIEYKPYLSHEFTFDWNPGSLLAFDRRKFHSSDNFLSKSVASKKAIITFTTIVNDPDSRAKTLAVPDQMP